MPKFGNKNALFGYFWAGIWKKKCHIWNQSPWICLLAKVSAKIKILKFGTKNTSFGYSCTGVWKQHRHIWNQRPWICLMTKFHKKWKLLSLGSKIPFIMYNTLYYVYPLLCIRARSLVVSDLRSETKGSRFESGCQLCAEVSCLQ